MVTLAAIFAPTQPPEQIGAVAAAADAAGLDQLWVWEDCFSESGIATATAMLATTSRVTVGIGLLPVRVPMKRHMRRLLISLSGWADMGGLFCWGRMAVWAWRTILRAWRGGCGRRMVWRSA